MDLSMQEASDKAKKDFEEIVSINMKNSITVLLTSSLKITMLKAKHPRYVDKIDQIEKSIKDALSNAKQDFAKVGEALETVTSTEKINLSNIIEDTKITIYKEATNV